MDKSVENLLRVLLLHLGCGYSLRETAVRARQAQPAELTAAAVWQRLRKARDWLHALCRELWREAGGDVAADRGLQVRALYATTVVEPGKTGSLWRLHYSDYLLADCGYSTARGLLHVERAGSRATVRVNTSSPPSRTPENGPFDLLAKIKGLRRAVRVGLRSAQDSRGHSHRPQGPATTGLEEGHAVAAAELGIRQVCDPVQDLPGPSLPSRGCAGAVPHERKLLERSVDGASLNNPQLTGRATQAREQLAPTAVRIRRKYLNID